MQTFSQFYHIIENYLREERFNKEFSGLYNPISYILTLPAKRVRPILFLLSHQLYDQDYEKVLPLSIALEWFHNFTLIHDDIMDAAPLRRGYPTIHNKYNINTAILSGDALLIYVYEHIRKYSPSEKLSDMLAYFNDAAIKVCEGQQRDIEFEQLKEVTFKEYELMISYKTAVLLAYSLKMGALAGGATISHQELLYSFGLNMGLAFQIQDDYLDIYGDEDKVGKQKAGDIIQAKKTAPYILALEKLEGIKKDNFIKLYTDSNIPPEVKLKEVMEIYQQLNIANEVLIIKEKYQSLAMNSLASVSTSDTIKQELVNLADQLLNRQV